MKVDLQPSAPPRQTQRPPSLFAAGKQEAGGRALKAKAARIPACPARVQFLFDNKNYTNPAKQTAPPSKTKQKNAPNSLKLCAFSFYLNLFNCSPRHNRRVSHPDQRSVLPTGKTRCGLHGKLTANGKLFAVRPPAYSFRLATKTPRTPQTKPPRQTQRPPSLFAAGKQERTVRPP